MGLILAWEDTMSITQTYKGTVGVNGLFSEISYYAKCLALCIDLLDDLYFSINNSTIKI